MRAGTEDEETRTLIGDGSAPDLEAAMASSTGRGAWSSLLLKTVVYTPANSLRLSMAPGFVAASRDVMLTCAVRNVHHNMAPHVLVRIRHTNQQMQFSSETDLRNYKRVPTWRAMYGAHRQGSE